MVQVQTAEPIHPQQGAATCSRCNALDEFLSSQIAIAEAQLAATRASMAQADRRRRRANWIIVGACVLVLAGTWFVLQLVPVVVAFAQHAPSAG
mgnify:FL=1